LLAGCATTEHPRAQVTSPPHRKHAEERSGGNGNGHRHDPGGGVNDGGREHGGSGANGATRSRSDTGGCPGNALMGVYHPYRLQVIAPCRWFRGRVTTIRHEEDGDYHVDVAPDPGFGRYLVHDNYTEQGGALVTEVMPGQGLPIPSSGEHVAVFGTWVLDTDHGWNEIHPIWAIRYLNRGTTVHRLPPVPPRYDPDAGGELGGSGNGGTGSGGAGGSGHFLPPPHDYDCSDFPTQRAAQRYLNSYPGDPSSLDGDNDGRACEDNP